MSTDQLATALRGALRYIESIPGLTLPADGSVNTEAWWALIEQPVATPRAADLPDGTVVATRELMWKKDTELSGHEMFPWVCINGGSYGNRDIDDVLALGARVLRYGYQESE